MYSKPVKLTWFYVVFLSDNILLDEKFVAKLSDFGITRFLSSSDKSRTQTQCAIGTSLYMSPEAMRGVVSIHGDVFALGIVSPVNPFVMRCVSPTASLSIFSGFGRGSC